MPAHCITYFILFCSLAFFPRRDQTDLSNNNKNSYARNAKGNDEHMQTCVSSQQFRNMCVAPNGILYFSQITNRINICVYCGNDIWHRILLHLVPICCARICTNVWVWVECFNRLLCMLYTGTRMQSGSIHLKLRKWKTTEDETKYIYIKQHQRITVRMASTSIDHFQAVAENYGSRCLSLFFQQEAKYFSHRCINEKKRDASKRTDRNETEPTVQPTKQRPIQTDMRRLSQDEPDNEKKKTKNKKSRENILRKCSLRE